MRLRTRLVLLTLLFTVLLTAALGVVFLGELLRGRMAQVAAANDVLAHELLLSMRASLEAGAAREPAVHDEASFEDFVANTLQGDEALRQTMDAIVSYSPTVQDVTVTGANGRVLVATDPELLAKEPEARQSFSTLARGSVRQQWAMLFGRPMVLDVALPLQRNGRPFLWVHIGVRSTLLRATLLPWLRDAAVVTAAALLCSLGVALLLSALALRPIERISRQLEALSRRERAAVPEPVTAQGVRRTSRLSKPVMDNDAEARVSSTIAAIDERMRASEQQATSLSHMLRALKDGMLLLDAEGAVVLQSDSVRHFLPVPAQTGTPIWNVFADAGAAALLEDGFRHRRTLRGVPVRLGQDGGGDRDVEVSLDFAENAQGAMLTLHDTAAREEIEREIEVSRRMASIGRLTAGVGHEVKNPIHAMVLHLELLRGKLQDSDGAGATRHVDVLAAEMSRLDQVVQMLADFSRPMEPDLREVAVSPVVQAIVRLVSVDAGLRGITIDVEDRADGATAVVDREMLHQSLLNIVLNALDAMPDGGRLALRLRRERGTVALDVQDNGSGMAPEVQERMFHLYFTTKEGGSGIGLAMTWRMVQMMGGTIAVRSVTDEAAADRGTLVTVRFPLAGRSPVSPPTSPATAEVAV